MIIIKETISDKEAICLIILFTWGSALVLGTGGDAKNDMWLAILLGMFLGMLITAMYSRILYNFPDKDIFDINIILFGKILGNAINMIFIFYALHLGALVLNNFSEFISTAGLTDTPKIVPIIFIIVIVIWIVKSGLEALGRFSSIFIFVGFITFTLSMTLSINQLNVLNIRPIMYGGIQPLLRGTFSAFAFPFAENVVFLMLFSSLKNKKSSFKVYWIGLLIAGIILSIISARNIMLAGSEFLQKNYFPSYVVVSRISLGDFIQRIETTIVVSFLLAGLVKISCCILAACKGISKVFAFDEYNFLATPVSLIVLSFSYIVYYNIIETINWAPHVYPIYALFFQVILPFIILIAAEIKIRKTKTKGAW